MRKYEIELTAERKATTRIFEGATVQCAIVAAYEWVWENWGGRAFDVSNARVIRQVPRGETPT